MSLFNEQGLTAMIRIHSFIREPWSAATASIVTAMGSSLPKSGMRIKTDGFPVPEIATITIL